MNFKKVPYEQNTLTELTPEQIEAAKKEFGSVYMIDVEGKKIYIHKPTRQIIDLAQISGRSKPSMFEETIVRNCWLAGDKQVVEDIDYFYAMADKINGIVEKKSAELVKL